MYFFSLIVRVVFSRFKVKHSLNASPDRLGQTAFEICALTVLLLAYLLAEIVPSLDTGASAKGAWVSLGHCFTTCSTKCTHLF